MEHGDREARMEFSITTKTEEVRYRTCRSCGELFACDETTWYCPMCGAVLRRPRKRRPKGVGSDAVSAMGDGGRG